MTTKTHDLAAVVGEKPDGKPRWQRCGSMFLNDEGKIRVKIDSVPISTRFDGWLAAFEVDDNRQVQKPAPAAPAPQAKQEGFDDDIPF